ncbi:MULTISPECIES: DUF4190 domain-containing protein [unclassified Streptomyces]|uniref:DUF4190 domain-containing protein n=1 Tax=unclassified Streptomyces TaxID=2593676 RepID=UPI003823B180
MSTPPPPGPPQSPEPQEPQESQKFRKSQEQEHEPAPQPPGPAEPTEPSHSAGPTEPSHPAEPSPVPHTPYPSPQAYPAPTPYAQPTPYAHPAPYAHPTAPYAVWGQGYVPFNRPAPVNGVAIAALVLGVLCFLPAVGLVLGIIALVQIRKRGERGTGMAIGGAVLSTLGLGLGVLMVATGGAAAVYEGFEEGVTAGVSLSLDVGDCFDVPGDITGDVYDVDHVECAGPHEGEVFGVVRLPGADYPGDRSLTDTAEDRCYALESTYAMDAWTVTDQVDVYYLTPTRDSWEWGDREITCVFTHTGDRGMLTGSLRSDATTLDADQLAFLKAANTFEETRYEEPEAFVEDDLVGNKAWASDMAAATAAQAKALRGRTWSAKVGEPVADLVKDLDRAAAQWRAAARAKSADDFYEPYDTAYGYVDGDATVTAREALGLATEPPDLEESAGGADAGADDGGLDV